MARAAGVLVLVLVLGVAACAGSPAQRAPSSRPPSATTPSSSALDRSIERPDLQTMCNRPTARAATGANRVGSPGAPTIGAHSFHPYPYNPGYPTKMIIYWLGDDPQTSYLQGWRCSDGRTLRLWYEGDPQLMGTPPYSTAKLMHLGDVVATIPPGVAGGSRGGYALFTSPGAWVLEVSARTQFVGSLRVDVTAA